MQQGRRVRQFLFLAFFLALFLLVARLFYPFVTVILWSALVYAFLEPLHLRLSRKRDGSERRPAVRTLLAGLFAAGGLLVIVLPAFFLGIALLRQAGELASSLAKAISEHPALLDLSPRGVPGGFINRLSEGRVDLSTVDLKGEILRFLGSRTGSIIGFSGLVLKDALALLVTLAFMLFSLFFFFADGRHLVRLLVRAVPIETRYTTLFLRKLKDTGRQLVLGYFLVALFQATVMFGICAVFRVKGSLVLACLTAVASFVPMIGTALVWIPVAATLALGGDIGGALGFLAASAFLVATLDNFLRPMLLHDRLKIHPLLIFFAILGGLKLFGFNGLVLGPLILMLFFAAAELFDEVYEREEGGESGG